MTWCSRLSRPPVRANNTDSIGSEQQVQQLCRSGAPAAAQLAELAPYVVAAELGVFSADDVERRVALGHSEYNAGG